MSDESKCNHNNEYYLLTEEDFYPPSDDRTWKSNVMDVVRGDNFVDFCEYYFDLLDEEEYFES